MKITPLFLLAIVLTLHPVAAKPLEIAVIPKGNTHEFWKSIHAGALKAERELTASGIPVHVIWKGPLREDDRDGQIQVVENFIGRQVNGMVLAPLDEKALVAPVEDAIAEGIPVTIVDSALKSKKISSFIATDNREGGRLAARRLGQLLGGKGKVILLRYAVGSASTEEREEGFLEVMRRDFPGIDLISTDQHAGATRDTARTVSENLLDRFGSQVDGIFASNESAAAGMLLALRDAGLTHKVKYVGFDAGKTLIDGLKTGDVQGLIIQNPYRIGYLGVKTVVAAIRKEKVPAQIDTGATLITPENMNEPANRALLHPPTAE